MRLAELADRLQALVPPNTDLFSNVVAISSIVSDGTAATINTDGVHDLVSGTLVNLSGVETRTPIVAVATAGFSHTFTTGSDHDLTENRFSDPIGQVRLDGFTDQNWNNADLSLADVPNRRSFTVPLALPTPALNGGEFLLEPNRLDGLNGIRSITVLSRTSFSIEGPFPSGTFTPINGKVSAAPRIGVAVDGPRALEIFESDPDSFWMFVVPDNAIVSKDRTTFSDAVSAKQVGTTLRLRVLDNFSVLVFAPVAGELAAEEAVDICRHDLLGPVVSALFGYRPETGLSCPASEFQIVLTGHQVEDYNKASLVYRYDFQAPIDLSSMDAQLDSEGSRAFRDIINYRQTNLHEPAEARINLDEVPL